MRLIDADKLKKIFNERYVDEARHDDDISVGACGAYWAAINLVDAAPTENPSRFMRWLAEYVTREDEFSEDREWMAELICRRLVNEGYLKLKNGRYYCLPEEYEEA